MPKKKTSRKKTVSSPSRAGEFVRDQIQKLKKSKLVVPKTRKAAASRTRARA